ncbi:hypothetical protein [Reyranella sp.]|uniref:hypothetical protein n=1 Tax=Reyranella sp. TaxID=1929291 RepID=UPI00403623B7
MTMIKMAPEAHRVGVIESKTEAEAEQLEAVDVARPWPATATGKVPRFARSDTLRAVT